MQLYLTVATGGVYDVPLENPNGRVVRAVCNRAARRMSERLNGR